MTDSQMHDPFQPDTYVGYGSVPGTVEETEPDAAGPADGTIDEVLERVGEDHELAQAALDAEQAKDEPRKTLIGRLEKVLAAEPA